MRKKNFSFCGESGIRTGFTWLGEEPLQIYQPVRIRLSQGSMKYEELLRWVRDHE